MTEGLVVTCPPSTNTYTTISTMWPEIPNISLPMKTILFNPPVSSPLAKPSKTRSSYMRRKLAKTVQSFRKTCMQCWPGRKGKKVTQQEVREEKFITVKAVDLPDTIASLNSQVSSLFLDTNILVCFIETMQETQEVDIGGYINGVSVEESQGGVSSVSCDAVTSVDIPQLFNARQYGMSAATEFLTDDGTGVGVDQVEKNITMEDRRLAIPERVSIDMSCSVATGMNLASSEVDMGFPDNPEIKPMATSMEEQTVGNIFSAETMVYKTVYGAGRMEYFDAKLYGMVEDYEEIGSAGHCVDISRTPGYLQPQATLSHPATSKDQLVQPYSVPCKVAAGKYDTRQLEEKPEDEELGLREAPVVVSSVIQSWIINEVGVKQRCQQADRYQGYLEDTLPMDTILQREKEAVMALHSMHGDKLCDTMVSASCTDFRLEQIFNKKEGFNNMEGEMVGHSEYAGGGHGVIIGAICNLGYSEAVHTAAKALLCVKDESSKHTGQQQEEEASRVMLEFEQNCDKYGMFNNHHSELEPSASLVGNLPQLNSCFKSVEVNPTDQGVKNMVNEISVAEEFINFNKTGTLAYSLASQECMVDSSKQGKYNYMPGMNRDFNGSDEGPFGYSSSICDMCVTGAAENIIAFVDVCKKEGEKSQLSETVEVKGRDHEAEFISLMQEILINSLVTEEHIRMWDMAKFLSQECSEIPAARSRIITSEVEVKDSSVLGVAQDLYAMARVYEIPEVNGDGAKDTQLDLGETKEVIDDNVETADDEFTKEAEPHDAASAKPELVMLGLFSAVGCIVEFANRFGLLTVDDPKERANSTHIELVEEEVTDKRAEVEDLDMPDYPGSDDEQLGSGSEGNDGVDMVNLTANMGPMAQEDVKKQDLQPSTILTMEEEERNMIDYEISDPTSKYNGLLGLGDENNFGDRGFLLADTGPGAELKEQQGSDITISTVEIQRTQEFSHIQTGYEVWIEPYSSSDETDEYVDIITKDEQYDVINSADPGWDIFPFYKLTWAEVIYDAVCAEYSAAREILEAACNDAINELVRGDIEEEREKTMI